MKIRLTISAVLITASMTFAQQDPQFSHNMFNRLAVNPGFAGANDAICGTLIGRNQWLGFEGAPRTFVLSADMPIPAIKGAAGLNIMSDNIGFEENIHARLGYAYHLKLGEGKLGVGLDVGMINKRLGSGLKPLETGDPSIPTGEVGATVFDAGFGAYYYTKKYYVGLSSTHLPQSTLDLSTSKYQTRRHYYLMAGYTHQLNPDVALVPSVFIKNAVTTQFDVNCNVFYQNKIWGGLSYRFQDAIIILAGMNVMKDLRLGLAYDINTSKLNPYNNGTLEFMLNYCFKLQTEKPRQVYRNVRYL